MLSFNTTIKISDLIRATLETEGQAEVIRQVLCEKSALEPYTAFKRISHLSSSITSQGIYDFLAENDIKIRKQDAFYLIRQYDTKGNGKLSYSEFLAAVLPKTDTELRREVMSRKTLFLEEDEGLAYQLEHAIARVFEHELESFHKCEVIRQELNLCEDFSILEAFREIDNSDEGFIDAEKLMRFMVRVDDPLTYSEANMFMLRIDKDNDGLIKYSDFVEVFYSSELEHENKNKNKQAQTNNDNNNTNTHKSPFSTPQKQPKQAGSNLTSGDNFFSPYSTKASMSTTSLLKTPPKKSLLKEFNETEEKHTADAVKTQPGSAQSPYFARSIEGKQGSPMKAEEEQELVKGLVEILEHIKELETAKNKLILKNDFNIYNAFALFDTKKKGLVSASQLEEGLKALGAECNKAHVELLVKRLDTNSDDLISLREFAHLLTPKAHQFASLLYSRQPYYISQLDTPQGAFSKETLETYTQLMKNLVELEGLSEGIRQRLAKRKSFNMNDAFGALNKNGNGFITAEDFQDLLEENGAFVAQKDIVSLVERYEKSEKGKVSYYDFVREMTPKTVIAEC